MKRLLRERDWGHGNEMEIKFAPNRDDPLCWCNACCSVRTGAKSIWKFRLGDSFRPTPSRMCMTNRRTIWCCNDQSCQCTAQQWLCAFSENVQRNCERVSQAWESSRLSDVMKNAHSTMCGREKQSLWNEMTTNLFSWVNVQWKPRCAHIFHVSIEFLVSNACWSLLHHKSSDKRLWYDRWSCSTPALTFKASAADEETNFVKVQIPLWF